VVQLLSHVLKEVTVLEGGSEGSQDGKQAQLTTVRACFLVPAPALQCQITPSPNETGIISLYSLPKECQYNATLCYLN
jgi:hypothetical protein